MAKKKQTIIPELTDDQENALEGIITRMLDASKPRKPKGRVTFYITTDEYETFQKNALKLGSTASELIDQHIIKFNTAFNNVTKK